MSKFAQARRRGGVRGGTSGGSFSAIEASIQCFGGLPRITWTYSGAEPQFWSMWRQIQSGEWVELESVLGSLRVYDDGDRTCVGSEATGYKVQAVVEGGGGPYSNTVYLETDPA